jgi:hypothetical protein
MLRRDPYAFRQPAVERVADDALGLGVSVAGRDIEQVDPGVDRFAQRRDGLVAGRRSPQLAEPAAAERQRADRPQVAEPRHLHRRRLP